MRRCGGHDPPHSFCPPRAHGARRSRSRQGRAGDRHDAVAGHLEPADQLDAGQVADQQHDQPAAHGVERRLEAGLPRLYRSADHRERHGAGDRPARRQEEHGGRPRTARPEMGRRRACHRQGCRLHPGSRPPSAVGRGLVGSLPAHHQVRRQGRPSLHHDDRPRHLRLQPHGAEPPAGAHREADLRGQSRRVPQQDGVRHQHDQPRPVLRSVPHRRGRARQPHRPGAEPDLDGREALLQAHRRQDHREHRGARGQPAVGQRRLRAGRARPVARPGAGLREAPQGQVQLHLQAGADLRAHRHHARQQASGRPPRAPGDPERRSTARPSPRSCSRARTRSPTGR